MVPRLKDSGGSVIMWNIPLLFGTQNLQIEFRYGRGSQLIAGLKPRMMRNPCESCLWLIRDSSRGLRGPTMFLIEWSCQIWVFSRCTTLLPQIPSLSPTGPEATPSTSRSSQALNLPNAAAWSPGETRGTHLCCKAAVRGDCARCTWRQGVHVQTGSLSLNWFVHCQSYATQTGHLSLKAQNMTSLRYLRPLPWGN